MAMAPARTVISTAPLSQSKSQSQSIRSLSPRRADGEREGRAPLEHRSPQTGSERALERQHRHRKITLIVAIGGERSVGLLRSAAEIDRRAIGRSRGRGQLQIL